MTPPAFESKQQREGEHLDPAYEQPAAADDPLNDLDATWSRLNEIISKKNPSVGASLSRCRLKQVSATQIEIEVSDY